MPTILIVDDDKHTRALLERIFQNDVRLSAIPGLTIAQAADGEEGLKVFDEAHPDVVVTDLLMPRMDGFRFCKAVREREGANTEHRVGLLVVSGVYRDATISSRLKDEYGAQFFTKPYQIKDMVSALAKLLADAAPRPAKKASEEMSAIVALSPPLPGDEPGSDGDEPARQGSFADMPLPRLLFDLHEARATGMLEMRRGGIEKRIDLVAGHPVAVSSNQRHEMLGHFLVTKGIISEDQHQQALERASHENEKIGEALQEMNVLTAVDLVKQLTSQARYKITGALRWRDGTWTYRPNRDLIGRAKGNAIDPVVVTFTGLKRTAALDVATRTVGGLAGQRLALSERGERFRTQIARVFGQPILGKLADQPPVEDLLQGDNRETIPALEALILTGCIEAGGAAAHEPISLADPTLLGELSGTFRGPMPPVEPRPAELYDALFADEGSGVAPLPSPPAGGTSHEPTELDMDLTLGPAGAPEPRRDGVPAAVGTADSSVIEVSAFGSGPHLRPVAPPSETARLREALLAEYLRIQAKDWYSVLGVRRGADSAAVDAEFTSRMAAFSLETYAQHDLGPDHGKLEEIHTSYREAYAVLTTPARRAVYDRQLAARGRTPDALAAELAFRLGEKRLAADDLPGAIEKFRKALASAPTVADYHASLGWALDQLAAGAGGDASEGLDELGRALVIDPDHPAGHEWMGRALARTGRDDDEAARFLELALDAQPPRIGALAPLEELRARRGELPLLEQRYRTLLARVQDVDPPLALRLWLALAGIYVSALADRDAARIAYQCAQRLAPQDKTILEALTELDAGDPARFGERAEALRARWRLDPTSVAPALELVRAAEEQGQPDVAVVTAGALVARGLADEGADRLWRRYRPRFLIRAHRTIDPEIWSLVRHEEDDPELGDVFALLEATAARQYVLGLPDLEISERDICPDAELPSTFRRVRDYVAATLGVARPTVARRADFGDQAHLGATSPPVLLVGPQLLESQNRLAIAFLLGRAMTFMFPGRTIGGSRPSRVLKELFTAAMELVHPLPGVDHEQLARARRAVEALPADDRAHLAEMVGRITSARTNVNLSRWARALARSADRAGLLLCGDIPLAAERVAALASSDAVEDLLQWAIGPQHLQARAALGVSVDV